jgi:hypothetical protein
MFDAGIPWAEALVMPLSDALAIAEAHLDNMSLDAYRQGQLVWASLAPHVTNKIAAPEPPKLDE